MENRNSSFLTASDEFSLCPILTHISFERFHIDESVPSALKRAIQSGMLPNLRCITLKGCCKHSSRLDWPHEVEVSMKYDIFGRIVEYSCKLCVEKSV